MMPHERSARNELRRLALVIIDRRYRDHVALIRSTAQNTAINRFDSLSVGDTGVETASQIHGHVVAAKREARRHGRMCPPEKTAKLVVPAPISTVAAPRSASSSARAAEPGHIGD